MEYYFADSSGISEARSELKVTGDEFNHLTRVLRKRTGDEISVTNGKGSVYHCVISDIMPGKLVCRIQGVQRNLFEPRLKIRLYMSPLKSRDRFEFAIEKAVELGVDSIVPVITERTVKVSDFSERKSERIRKIILSAMSQSQRCWLPEFHESVSMSKLLEDTKFDINKVVMYEFSGDRTKKGIDKTAESLSLLIGPEGGFTDEELELLLQNNWMSKSLGHRKFRAETAAIVSVYELLNH